MGAGSGLEFGIRRLEAKRLLAHAAAHNALQAYKCSSADEEDVGGVNGGELLVGVLASALRRHIGHGAFKNLEQGLLHALAGNIARDRGILVLAADLVDLVDVDDALLGARYVAVGGLEELEYDVFNVFAHIAGLSQRGSVHNGEGNV